MNLYFVKSYLYIFIWSAYMSGFCHFGLVSFMGFVTEPWYSGHVLFLCECAASNVLEPCALSSACLVSCWSVVFGSRHSSLEFRFRVRVRTLKLHALSRFGSMLSRVCSALSYSVHACCVSCCCTQFVFYRLRAFMLCLLLVWQHSLLYSLAACVHVVISCVNTCLMSILISCLSCPVLHMACDFVLLAMCLCFCFVWAHGFVLDFCVPCALVSICLDPTHFVPDYWLICPPVFPRYPPHLLPLWSPCVCSPVFYFNLANKSPSPAPLSLASPLHPQPWHLCPSGGYV